MKVGFVILCYGNFPMIQECIEKLLLLDHISEAEIILIDNCSPDGTGIKMETEYRNIRNIHVLLSEENLGFAKGNNLGYQYAKESLSCDVQVVMNSDVFIDDRLFIEKLMATIQSEHDVSIFGPDALGKNGRHTNPLYGGQISADHARKNIKYNNLANILLRLHIDYYKGREKQNNANEEQEKRYNIMPHGCCVIFGPEWIKQEDKAFWPGTFLFCEEYFLTAYALESGYKTMYAPELVVRHLGDGSIDADTGNERKKRIFINTKQNESLKKYLEFMKNAKKNWMK